MYENLKEITKNLDPQCLEDIFIANKLQVQGFRIGGPTNSAKTMKMINILLKQANLETIFNKAAIYYKEKRNADFSWALVSNLSIDDVKKKLEDSKLHEVLFALISAEKVDMLITSQSTEKVINEVHTEGVTSDLAKFELGETVVNLRGILTELEKTNKALT